MTNKILIQIWDYIKKAKVELILVVALLFVDLFSKRLVANLWGDKSYQLIGNFLYVYYIKNYNAAFGSDFGLSNLLGPNGIKAFFIIFTFAMLAAFCYMLFRWRNRRAWIRVMIAFIIAGGFGNLYDRLLFGFVRDFVSIVFFGKDLWLLGTEFAIFNLADSFLIVGMIGFVWYVLFMYDKDTKRLNDDAMSPKNYG